MQKTMMEQQQQQQQPGRSYAKGIFCNLSIGTYDDMTTAVVGVFLCKKDYNELVACKNFH
jgi:hypothetical protein